MPKPWKTTSKKIPTQPFSGEPVELKYETSAPDPFFDSLEHLMFPDGQPENDEELSKFAVTLDDLHNSENDPIAALVNDYNALEAELRRAAANGSKSEIRGVLRNMQVQVNLFLDANHDLNDHVTAQFYRLQQQLTMVQSLQDACEDIGSYFPDELANYGRSLTSVRCDPFQQGFLPSGDEELNNFYQENIGKFNENLDKMAQHLEKLYPKYLESLSPQQKEGKTDDELRSQFEQTYYRKFRQYQEDMQAYSSFCQVVKEHLTYFDRADVAIFMDTLMRGKDTPCPPEYMPAVIAMMEQVGAEDKISQEVFDRRVEELENLPENALQELFTATFSAPFRQRFDAVENAGSTYEFRHWEELVGEQSKIARQLGKKHAGQVEKILTDQSAGMADPDALLIQAENRTRPVYAAVHQQLISLNDELSAMSTRVGGNSEFFDAMLGDIRQISQYIIGDPADRADKDHIQQALRDIANTANAYVIAKRTQKGITDPAQEPKFRTGQGLKRYQYAKRIAALAADMTRTLKNCDNAVSTRGANVYGTAKDILGHGWRQQLEKNRKQYASMANVPQFVQEQNAKYDHLMNSYDSVNITKNLQHTQSTCEQLENAIRQAGSDTNRVKELKAQLRQAQMERMQLFMERKEMDEHLKTSSALTGGHVIMDRKKNAEDVSKQLHQADLKGFGISKKRYEQESQRLHISQTKRQQQRNPQPVNVNQAGANANRNNNTNNNKHKNHSMNIT